MPELPEVERAAGIARAAVVGRTITSVRVLHPAQRRGLPARAARSLIGDRVEAVVRRGKAQRFRLASGRELRVHFRMTGDWVLLEAGEVPPRAVRAIIALDDGTRLALHDPRALSVISLGMPEPDEGIGPEATDPTLTPARLASALAGRRIAIKQALLDQSIVAGIGNIYASEALWRARLDPRLPANRLEAPQLRRLVSAIRATMRIAMARHARYYGRDAGEGRFAVYDREGQRCRRCGAKVKRIVQAGRSTYFCLGCQGAAC